MGWTQLGARQLCCRLHCELLLYARVETCTLIDTSFQPPVRAHLLTKSLLLTQGQNLALAGLLTHAAALLVAS